MPAEGGKSDMDRIGLFSEMEYITIGDKYVSPFNRPFNEAASKSRQMLPGGSKEMSHLQQGYFDPHFVRIFEGEGYINLNQVRRRHMMEEAKKNLGKPFLPSSGGKKPCGFGSYYGTIGGPLPFFSVQLKPREKYQAPGKNLYTNPGKKGTGYGYANLTIGKQPSHAADFYDEPKLTNKKENEAHRHLLKGSPFKLSSYPKEYFDNNPYFFDKPLPPIKKAEKPGSLATPFKPSSPGKKAGGMKAGTFDPYPSHSADPYVTKLPRHISGKIDKIFHPPGGPKSRPMTSIMTLNVKRNSILCGPVDKSIGLGNRKIWSSYSKSSYFIHWQPVTSSLPSFTYYGNSIPQTVKLELAYHIHLKEGTKYEELQDCFSTVLLKTGRQIAL